MLPEGPKGFPRTIPRPPGPQCPPGLAPQAPFRKFQGFVALAIVLRTALRLGSGVPLCLAVPNAMAESPDLAGPPDPDVGDVPVEAPAPAASNTGLWQEHRPRRAQLQRVPHICT